MPRLAALFTADADQLTSSGEWRRGRDELVRGTLASSKANSGARTITIKTVRFPAPDVAIADGEYVIGASRHRAGPEHVDVVRAGSRRRPLADQRDPQHAPAARRNRACTNLRQEGAEWGDWVGDSLVAVASRRVGDAARTGPRPARRTARKGWNRRCAARGTPRDMLFAELQPVKLTNCELARYGEDHDGGYLACRNLLSDVRAGYSYGISGYDGWGCEISTELNVPVHQYDCFNTTGRCAPPVRRFSSGVHRLAAAGMRTAGCSIRWRPSLPRMAMPAST